MVLVLRAGAAETSSFLSDQKDDLMGVLEFGISCIRCVLLGIPRMKFSPCDAERKVLNVAVGWIPSGLICEICVAGL